MLSLFSLNLSFGTCGFPISTLACNDTDCKTTNPKENWNSVRQDTERL